MLRNSSPNAEDPRVKRTQKCLWEALRTLLEESSFEQISVTDICEEATINRTTFYKHFESKYELLSYGLKYDQETAQRKRRRVRSACSGMPRMWCNANASAPQEHHHFSLSSEAIDASSVG